MKKKSSNVTEGTIRYPPPTPAEPPRRTPRAESQLKLWSLCESSLLWYALLPLCSHAGSADFGDVCSFVVCLFVEHALFSRVTNQVQNGWRQLKRQLKSRLIWYLFRLLSKDAP